MCIVVQLLKPWPTLVRKKKFNIILSNTNKLQKSGKEAETPEKTVKGSYIKHIKLKRFLYHEFYGQYYTYINITVSGSCSQIYEIQYIHSPLAIRICLHICSLITFHVSRPGYYYS